ncbi:TIGR03751 family conjugal transfer lipoprotein [Billgrantia antri]|uniref:TIGR03751 family conjugal transfer lipoprotein n=1 Tax=Halomonas sulfidivorans TaxID=2733488 RepID=A0ABX7WL51_9GAMM|nr:TIGR03751 family conjugal transfer lipoprotein [Halomonas sulfidivorans]
MSSICRSGVNRAARSAAKSSARPLAALMTILLVAGCATSQEELMPVGDTTMMEIWQHQAGHSTGERRLLDVRSELRRPLDSPELVSVQLRYSRDASNEIYSQFRRLPNPDLVMYVFPHLAGTEQVPVPGYSTVFPLYQRTQYAMPGESARPTAALGEGKGEVPGEGLSEGPSERRAH